MRGFDSGIRSFCGLRCRIQLRRVHGVWQQRHVWYRSKVRPHLRSPDFEHWIHAGHNPRLERYREVGDVERRGAAGQRRRRHQGGKMRVWNEETRNMDKLTLPAATAGVPAQARADGSRPDPLVAYMASLGRRSRRTTMIALNRVAHLFDKERSAADLPWELLRHEHVAAVRSRLADRYAPATANTSLAAVRGVLKSAWRLGLMSTDDYHRAVDVRTVPGSRLPAGRALDTAEIATLLRSCVDDDGPGARRDGALLALLAGAGLRRSEAAALQVGDYDDGEESVTVIGKGSKERKVFLMRGGKKLIDAWLDVRGRDPGPMLLKVDRLGRIARDGEGMTDQAVMLRVAGRSRRIGIGKVSPHDLRRTYITLLLEAGADVLSVQRLAGHASMDTTSLYDVRPDREARKAARSVRLI